MLTYIILVIAILVLPMTKINKKKYCIIIGLLMTAIIGLRSIDMGMGDTREIYISIFDQLANLTMKESVNFIKNADIEFVFYMMTKIYLLITENLRVYIFLLSIPLNLAVSRLIYKYSKMPSVSFIMFLSLNYFGFSFTLIRHCIALAILIYSYDFIYEKDIKKFLISVFIAGLFHRTAWLFLIAYPISNYVKIGEKNWIIPIIAAIFSYLFGTKLLTLLSYVIKSGHFTQYLVVRQNTLTFFIINLLILLFVLFVIKKLKIEKNMKLQINLLSVGTSIASCMIFLSETFRISSFFTIFSIILLPNTICLIKNKKIRLTINIIFYVVFITYFFMFSMENNQIYPYMIGGWNK